MPTAALDPIAATMVDVPSLFVSVPPVKVAGLAVPEVPVVVLNPTPLVTQFAVVVAALPLNTNVSTRTALVHMLASGVEVVITKQPERKLLLLALAVAICVKVPGRVGAVVAVR